MLALAAAIFSGYLVITFAKILKTIIEKKFLYSFQLKS